METLYTLPPLTEEEAEFLQELLEDKMLELEKVLSTDYEAGEQYGKLIKFMQKLDPYLPQEGYSTTD